MNDQFGLLYAAPSFLEGLARSIDIGDTLTEYNYSETGQAGDQCALRADWLTVGNDLRQAMEQYRREHPQELTNG